MVIGLANPAGQPSKGKLVLTCEDRTKVAVATRVISQHDGTVDHVIVRPNQSIMHGSEILVEEFGKG